MGNSRIENNGHAEAWFRSKKGLIILAILIVCIFVVLLSVLNPKNNLTYFTCSPLGFAQVFTVSANVNLTDGMDQHEAIEVATEVFDRAVPVDKKAGVQSLDVKTYKQDENGTWTVEISYIYSVTTTVIQHFPHYTIFHSETLKTIINPFSKTVDYTIYQ